MVDQDYLQQLSPEELAWMAGFNDRYYGADFRGDAEWSPEERREAYGRKNAANADMYERTDYVAKGDAEAVDLLEAPEADLDPLPGFLSDPRYQGALETFRAHLAEGRADRNPTSTQALEDARAELERIVHDAPEESSPEEGGPEG